MSDVPWKSAVAVLIVAITVLIALFGKVGVFDRIGKQLSETQASELTSNPAQVSDADIKEAC